MGSSRAPSQHLWSLKVRWGWADGHVPALPFGFLISFWHGALAQISTPPSPSLQDGFLGSPSGLQWEVGGVGES